MRDSDIGVRVKPRTAPRACQTGHVGHPPAFEACDCCCNHRFIVCGCKYHDAAYAPGRWCVIMAVKLQTLVESLNYGGKYHDIAYAPGPICPWCDPVTRIAAKPRVPNAKKANAKKVNAERANAKRANAERANAERANAKRAHADRTDMRNEPSLFARTAGRKPAGRRPPAGVCACVRDSDIGVGAKPRTAGRKPKRNRKRR